MAEIEKKDDFFEKFAAFFRNIFGKGNSGFAKLVNKLCTREIITYLISGVLTTVVNWLLYYLIIHVILGVESKTNYTADENLKIHIGNTIDWILTVAFAYVINAYWVFVEKREGFSKEIKKLLKFYGARLLTFLIEEGGMLLFITFLSFNDIIVKVVIAVVVVILNYVFSKLFVFAKKE